MNPKDSYKNSIDLLVQVIMNPLTWLATKLFLNPNESL